MAGLVGNMLMPWHIGRSRFDDVWKITRGSPEVVVAILDTGLDIRAAGRGEWRLAHRGLGPDQRFILGSNYVFKQRLPIDLEGHGTGIAGILAGRPMGFFTGLDHQCTVLVIKVHGLAARDLECNWALGIREAVDYGIQNTQRMVVNLSAGGQYSSVLREAIDYAEQHEVTVVTIAHNDNSNTLRFPGAFAKDYPNVICVGATDINDQRAIDRTSGRGSNMGPHVTVAAPGTGIVTTDLGNAYRLHSGTSAAAPQVAALCSLLLAVNPELTSSSIKEIITNTAERHWCRNEQSHELGWGRINALRAVRAADAQRRPP